MPDVEAPTFDWMTARLALTLDATAGRDAAIWSSKAWAAYRAKDFAAVLTRTDDDADDDDADDDDAPKMPAKTRMVALTAGAAVVPSPGITIPPTFADGLTAIAGPFDPFRELLRATPEVSKAKRTAYRKRKPTDEFESEGVPKWTLVHGRRDLDKPQWWQPHAGNIYLVVPYSLPGYDAVFGASLVIDGFALYSLVDGELRIVRTNELDQRDFRCGDESAIWALFFDSEATALYEVLGCTNAGEPDACATRFEENELRNTCTLAMPEALASR